jgi:hypothetical protein
MKGMVISGESVSDNVYLVTRVFDLGQRTMGLKFYLDPVGLKRDGRLLFKPSKYEVTPVTR